MYLGENKIYFTLLLLLVGGWDGVTIDNDGKQAIACYSFEHVIFQLTKNWKYRNWQSFVAVATGTQVVS